MRQLLKNLILLTLALAVVITGGWYLSASAERARAAINVPGYLNRIPDIIGAMGDVANINLSSFESLDQISGLFDTIGGDNQTMGQMSDWLSAFGQMGGGVEDLLDGNFRSIGDIVNGLGQITDLGGSTEILGSLGDLGATADDILNGGVNFNNASDLIGSLSEIRNSDTVRNILDNFKDKGGTYDDIVTAATENGTDIGTIITDPEITSEDLPPPGSGNGSQTSSGINTGSNNRSGVGTEVGQTSKEAQQDLNKERKQDEKECKAETGGGLLDGFNFGQATGGQSSTPVDVGGNPISGGVTSTDLPAPSGTSKLSLGGIDLGGLASNGLTTALSSAGLDLSQISKIPGLSGVVSQIPVVGQVAGGLLGGSSYVPVVEQDGDLLDLTDDTNSLTGEIKDLQVQICTHLKTIKRIQLNFEDKEFVGDVKAREEAAENLTEWKKQTFKLVTEGRTTPDGNDGNNYTPTPEGYVGEQSNHAEKLAINQVKQSKNIFADEVAEVLELQAAQNPLASDLARNQYDEFVDPKKSKELDSKSWWADFLKIIQPQNRPETSLMLAAEQVALAKQQASSRAMAEWVAGGGVVSNYTYSEKDESGNYTRRETQSPGSVIGRSLEEATLLNTQQNVVADESSDLSGVDEPDVSETETLTSSDSQTGGNTGGNGTPTGGGQAPGGTGDNDDFDLDGILNLFDFDMDDDGVDNDNDNNNFTIPDFGFPIDWSDVLDNIAPVVTLKLTGPSLDQIYEGRSNVANVAWRALNADECTAKNNWLSSSLVPNRTEAVREIGDDLDTSGSLTVYLPLTFDIRLERVRGNQTAIIGYATSTNAALTQQVTAITLDSSEVAAGDRFSLIAKSGLSDEAKITIETNVASASAVNDLLGAALTQLSANSTVGQEFAKYRITFTANQSGTAFITVTADPIYSLTCANDDKTTSKTVTVSRGD